MHVVETVNEYSVHDNQSVGVSEQLTCDKITVIVKGRFALISNEQIRFNGKSKTAYRPTSRRESRMKSGDCSTPTGQRQKRPDGRVRTKKWRLAERRCRRVVALETVIGLQ